MHTVNDRDGEINETAVCFELALFSLISSISPCSSKEELIVTDAFYTW